MVASSKDTISDKSFVSIRYLWVYGQLGLGPAAVYKSECIRISVCRVAQGQEACGSSRELL